MGAIYFSHPVKTYETEEAFEVYRALRRAYPDYEIIDPEDHLLEKTGFHVTCRECVDAQMKKVFFPLIDRCEKIAIWPVFDTCGIRCEAVHATMAGKELLHIEYILSEKEIEIDSLTLQELCWILKEVE